MFMVDGIVDNRTEVERAQKKLLTADRKFRSARDHVPPQEYKGVTREDSGFKPFILDSISSGIQEYEQANEVRDTGYKPGVAFSFTVPGIDVDVSYSKGAAHIEPKPHEDTTDPSLYLKKPKDVKVVKLSSLAQDITDMIQEQQDSVMVHSGNVLYNTRMGNVTHANEVCIPGKNVMYCGSAHLKGPGLDSGGQMGVENVYDDSKDPKHYDPIRNTQKVLDNKRTK